MQNKNLLFVLIGLFTTSCCFTTQNETQSSKKPFAEIVQSPEKSKKDKTVFFTYNSYALSDETKDFLNIEVVAWMKENPKIKITIEGHADERGTDIYNDKLGEERAAEVKKYLVQNGISKDRVRVTSRGESKPLDKHHDEDAWTKNRRVVTISQE